MQRYESALVCHGLSVCHFLCLPFLLLFPSFPSFFPLLFLIHITARQGVKLGVVRDTSPNLAKAVLPMTLARKSEPYGTRGVWVQLRVFHSLFLSYKCSFALFLSQTKFSHSKLWSCITLRFRISDDSCASLSMPAEIVVIPQVELSRRKNTWNRSSAFAFFCTTSLCVIDGGKYSYHLKLGYFRSS